MIKLIELYDAAKLPLVDVEGNRIDGSAVLADPDRIVKSIGMTNEFDFIVEFEEDETE